MKRAWCLPFPQDLLRRVLGRWKIDERWSRGAPSLAHHRHILPDYKASNIFLFLTQKIQIPFSQVFWSLLCKELSYFMILPFLCSYMDKTSKSFLTQALWGSSELSPAHGVPSCRLLFPWDQMRLGSETGKKPMSWTLPEGAGTDSPWAIKNTTTAAHCRFSTLKTKKLKGRLILPITSSEEQWWDFKKCRKLNQDVESQAPSSQSGLLVLLTMVLLPLLTQTEPSQILGSGVGRHHKPDPGWASSTYPRIAGMGLEENSPSSLTDC